MTAARAETARENKSTRATFSKDALENPFAEGAFRWVAEGKYTEGERQGERCVTKWFKKGSVYEDEFFREDIKAVEKTIDLVSAWNNLNIVNKTIMVNRATVWTCDRRSGNWRGRKTLTEPFIHHFRKFNSNSGWANSKTPWPKVMQALSHFSYHVSGGQFVLCDLQGGIYSNAVVLTDPVILSRTRSYGVTDLGPSGILTFFHRHVCNEYCSRKWSQPRETAAYFPERKGTSMELTTQHHVPTEPYRPQLSAHYEDYEDSDSDY
ncbi:TPA: LOW QUALITY PROTEIN: hypothetical protein N0F65_010317 [Lagenidium giganteum]|uniref:Alpha-type protein kinase domain-containing protein n=1 Tax=Lagenidium giganteum TaxID=4803 RepID=A0AAV2Z5W0_9STRA|nr:TPA: LOW QUALITY PROTEIN: hypothetical protein N0F65_010317 [Lagenidium giganteum]